MRLVATMDPNDHENRSVYCDHTLLKVSSIPTNTGYRV